MAQNFKANLIALSAVLALPIDFTFVQRAWNSCIGAIAAKHGIGGLYLDADHEPAHAEVQNCNSNDAIKHVFGEDAYHALFHNHHLFEYSLTGMHATLDRYIKETYTATVPVSVEHAPLSLNAVQLAQLFDSMQNAAKVGMIASELTLVDGVVNLMFLHKFS